MAARLQDGAFPALDARWRAQAAGAVSGERYELQEPLLALQHTLARALHMPGAEGASLLLSARAARASGRLTQAMAALHDLQAALRCDKRRCNVLHYVSPSPPLFQGAGWGVTYPRSRQHKCHIGGSSMLVWAVCPERSLGSLNL